MRATASIYLTETDSEPVGSIALDPPHPERPNTTAYGLNLVLAQTAMDDIRLTVRESADLDEDLILNFLGKVLFVENTPENVGDATDYEIDSGGWVELRIGDDLVDEGNGFGPSMLVLCHSLIFGYEPEALATVWFAKNPSLTLPAR